jgi:hypothetical protein
MQKFSIKCLHTDFNNILMIICHDQVALIPGYIAVQQMQINTCNIGHTQNQKQKPHDNLNRCIKNF